MQGMHSCCLRSMQATPRAHPAGVPQVHAPHPGSVQLRDHCLVDERPISECVALQIRRVQQLPTATPQAACASWGHRRVQVSLAARSTADGCSSTSSCRPGCCVMRLPVAQGRAGMTHAGPLGCQHSCCAVRHGKAIRRLRGCQQRALAAPLALAAWQAGSQHRGAQISVHRSGRWRQRCCIRRLLLLRARCSCCSQLSKLLCCNVLQQHGVTNRLLVLPDCATHPTIIYSKTHAQVTGS
jgi:hypothetical protein